MSLAFPVLRAFRKLFFFLLDTLFTSCVIHGCENLVDVNLDGTCCSCMASSRSLMKVHIVSIGLVVLNVKQNYVVSASLSFRMTSMLALFHRKILRATGLLLRADTLAAICTIS